MSITRQIRATTADDLAAIVELSNACDLAERGEATTTYDEVRSNFVTDGFVSGVIEGDGGELLAYVWVERQPDHQTVYGDYGLRPGADASLEPELFGWLRARAAELGPALAPHVFADVRNTTRRALFEAAGGVEIRRSYWMGINFGEAAPPDVPALADGVEIRPMTDTEDDLRAMHRVIDTAFEDHYNHEPYTFERWREGTIDGASSDLSLWWLATVDSAPAAGIYGYVLPDSGYIASLGTLREFRGRGLARALLLTGLAAFYQRGLPRATLGVDATNPTGALALYQSVGMRADVEEIRYQLPRL